jgi:hypothetical protein
MDNNRIPHTLIEDINDYNKAKTTIIAELQKKNVELEKKVSYLEGLLAGMKVWYDPKTCKFPPGNE